MTTVALDTSPRDEAAADTSKAEPAPKEPPAASTVEPEPEAPPTKDAATMQLADHGKPPYVPFPAPESAQTTTVPVPENTTPESDDKAAAPAPEPSSAAAPEHTAENTGPGAQADDALDHAWFRDRPRARAVIQLAAFASIEGARRMIETHADADLPAEDWHLYAQRVNGRLLYTVTWGDFPSSQRARHAIDALPEALRSLDPYPRSVGDVQDRIAEG